MKLHVIGTVVFTLLVSFVPVCKSQLPRETIEIHDNQYACYNSMQYFIIDSSFSIGNYSEEGDIYDSGYTQEELLDTILSKTRMRIFENFMAHFPFDSLGSSYESGINKSCDSLRQIYIQINWRGKKKDIQIEDCYQKNIGMLLNAINNQLSLLW